MYIFKIYNRSDVKEADRIVWNGENYNIRGIRREGEQRLYLLIDAEPVTTWTNFFNIDTL